MFSLLLRPEAPFEQWPRITTLAALALCKAIEAELPLQPRIKWPNDIYLSDRKVSGLLAETVSTTPGHALVLGIGLNVNTREFAPGIVATSLLNELQTPPAPNSTATPSPSACWSAFTPSSSVIDDDFSAAIAEVRERSWLLGRQIRAKAPQGEVFGRVLDLERGRPSHPRIPRRQHPHADQRRRGARCASVIQRDPCRPKAALSSLKSATSLFAVPEPHMSMPHRCFNHP
jgi:BirA family biotin operon repressor/biotin-[acetyl-CoA-carboxylase] ligase